ncbi:hypothetical protein [Pluralibacter gergoviae]|uniref:Uncharacterized protein n=1 Tax=Pluralibacter gergoviae TaxID=61647 RepID=A0AAW8HTG1_PLUGE|nr:hypothetical protein [Pluralibacter gergoviae]MDQ2310529.1 hypothetical protein [Pluralibacter gergoviae]SUB72339.1 Uncharacterised protein [Pluralibacter gergoviae]HDS1116850.1 hypothetical protein [Pluralibacter gergoviae]
MNTMKINIPLTTLATGIALLSGIIYIYGLWIRFEIPTSTLLNFINFSDIIKSSLYPLALISIIIFIDIPKFIKVHNGSLRESNNKKSWANKSKLKDRIALMIILVGICILYLYAKDFPNAASFVILLITFSASYYISDLESLINIQSNIKNHSIKISLLIPFFAFHYGTTQSAIIKEDPDVMVIAKDSHCENLPLAFIAAYSDKVFAYNKTNNSICIVSADSVELNTSKNPEKQKSS